MEQPTMQQYKRWFARFAMLVFVLGLGFAIGMSRRSSVGAADGGGPDTATIKNSADLIQIYNLEAQYANALDSGRLGEVADLFVPTGGFADYYQDPVTTHLINNGHPLDMHDQPITDFPNKGDSNICVIFGRENLTHYFHEGGNSIRPHVAGWLGGVGEYPGTTVHRHGIQNMWAVVSGDKATLKDYYSGTMTTAETSLVRTPAGWKFLFKKVVEPKPTPLSCHIYDTKFPVPSPASVGVTNYLNPD